MLAKLRVFLSLYAMTKVNCTLWLFVESFEALTGTIEEE